MEIASFSIAVCGGAALALLLFALCAHRCQLNGTLAQRFALLALPLGVFGGHLLYALALLRETLAEYGAAFLVSPWRGGFMFYGVIAGVALAALLLTRGHRPQRLHLLDCAAPALTLLIAVVRFAEPLDGQGRGLQLSGDEPWAFFPIAYAFNPRWPDEMDYAVFMLEGLWALVVIALALRRLKSRPAGKTACLTLVLYASGQILLESLRRDVTVRWRFVRVSQVISALVLLALLCLTISRRLVSKKAAVWRLIGIFACAGVVVGMEFAVDKPLHLPGGGLYYFPLWQVYGLIAVCAALIGINVWTAVRHMWDGALTE